MNNFGFWLIGLLVVATVGCGNRRPDEVLPRVTYVKVLSELEMSRTIYQASGDSSMADSARKAVLEHYRITPKQFRDTRTWYRKEGQEHQILRDALDQLNQERDQLRKYIKEQEADSTTGADTAADSSRPSGRKP